MKKWAVGILFVCAVAAASVVFNDQIFVGSVQIQNGLTLGTGSIDPSAAFEVQSTDQGSSFAPSMTEAQRDAISSPADGLTIFNTDTAKHNSYNGEAWIELGSGGGSGAGGVVFLFQDFEEGTAGETYSDISGIRPDDGTGGSSNWSIALETANPIIGEQSLKITVPDSNTQAQGYSILSETIDEAYQGQVQTLELYLKPSSEMETESPELELFVYYPTSDVVEALSFINKFGKRTNELPTTNEVEKIQAEFQPLDDTYRIIIHNTSATVPSAEYTFLIDGIRAGPNRVIQSPIVTEWVPYDLEITADTSNPSKATTPVVDEARWRRVGDSMEIQYRYSHTNNTGASSGTGTYSYSLPNGLQIDLSKVGIDSASSGLPNVGGAQVFSTTEGSLTGEAFVRSETELGLFVGSSTEAFATVSSTYNFLSESTVQYNFYAKVPIQGWRSGNVVGSTQIDQEVGSVISGSQTPTGTLGAAFNTVIFGTIDQDDFNGSYNTSTGVWTAPKTGEVFVGVRLEQTHSSSAGTFGIQFRDTTASASYLTDATKKESADTTSYVNTSGIVPVVEGNEYVIRSFSNFTSPVYASSFGGSRFEIKYQPDLSVFATFPEKNLVQTKFLSADVTSDGAISDLTFSNLTVGKWYEVTGLIRTLVNSGASDAAISVDVTHDSSVIKRVNYSAPATGTGGVSLDPGVIFQATQTTLTFVTTSASANSLIRGNGAGDETFIQLEERNDLRETDKF